jgi:hypothetical protein
MLSLIIKNMIVPVVLHGCGTSSVTLREEHRWRVFEDRVLRIFGPDSDEGTGQWKKLHSGELHNLYSSPDIIRQVKLRRMRWVGHVACMERGETCTGFWWESPRERGSLKDQGVDGRIGSNWTLERLTGGCGVDSSG